MFDQLGQKLQGTFKKLTGKGKLSEKDIDDALKEIKMSLLEADVNFKVVKRFLSDVKERAMGDAVFKSLTPGQQVVKIVHESMSELIGGTASDIKYSGNPPTVIVMAGVQGSGKTTSAAKLALFLKNRNKKTIVAACDTQRAAAVEQLKVLCDSIGVETYYEEGRKPEEIAKAALSYAKKQGADVLIADTAGRQHVDKELMDEIGRICGDIKPNEVLFVVDCMMGQQAVDAAAAFDEKIDITGFVLSKADSDARGGAALSVCYIAKKPIKFAGTGEKLSEFELFHPDRVASRILGMGDVLSVIEKAQQLMDEDASMKLAGKLQKNEFTLDDYLEQMDQLANMGGIEEMLKMMPTNAKMPNINVDAKQLARTKAIIQSMTRKERVSPNIINASRRRRIATGSGTSVADVNRLLKGFEQSRKMIKQLSSQKRRPGSKMNFPFMS